MEVLGLCSYCGRPARYSCSMCGRPVCSQHFDRQSHMCHNCSPERLVHGHERPPDRLLLH